MSGTSFLSVPQVAERLGVDVRTVRRMVGLGHLPAEYVSGRTLVPARAVDALAREERVAHAAEVGAAYALRMIAALLAEGWTPPRTGGGR